MAPMTVTTMAPTTVSDDGADDGHDDGDHEDGDHDDANCVTSIEVHKVADNQHGGTLTPADFQLLLDGQPQAQRSTLRSLPT